MIERYLSATRNKIGLARRHLEELKKLRAGELREREDIQMHFEGVLRNGESAADQIAEAVALELGLAIRTNSPRKLVKEVDEHGALHPAISRVQAWIDQPIVVDAHKRRRDAVHHHYEKRPSRPEGTWILEPQAVDGRPSPYQGRLDVHTYCEAYVATLAWLEGAADQLERP